MKGWLLQNRATLLFSAVCLAFYMVLPWVAHPFLCLFGVFPLAVLAAGFGFSLWDGFRWIRPALAVVLFVPAMFLHYNESAWIYLPVYGILCLIGCSAGAWIRRAKAQ